MGWGWGGGGGGRNCVFSSHATITLILHCDCKPNNERRGGYRGRAVGGGKDGYRRGVRVVMEEGV